MFIIELCRRSFLKLSAFKKNLHRSLKDYDVQALSETHSVQTIGKVPVFILQKTVRFFTNALKCFAKTSGGTASLSSGEIQPSGRRCFRVYEIIRVMPDFF